MGSFLNHQASVLCLERIKYGRHPTGICMMYKEKPYSNKCTLYVFYN